MEVLRTASLDLLYFSHVSHLSVTNYIVHNKVQYCFNFGGVYFARLVTCSDHAVTIFTNRNLPDAELLRVAAATALPPSPYSSPVHSLASQLSTAHIGTPMDTTTSTTDNPPVFTSGPHVPVKLLPFDSKQPKRWFQQTDAIFRQSHVVLPQTKWDYLLPKLPTDVLNDISNVMDSLTDATPNPYELVRNCLLETYTPTNWQLAQQLLSFPQVSCVRPTTLMNQLLSLLPEGDHPEKMFLLLFLDRLPSNISVQLTAPRTFHHPAYADQIWDSTPPPVQPVAALPPKLRSTSLLSTVSMW